MSMIDKHLRIFSLERAKAKSETSSLGERGSASKPQAVIFGGTSWLRRRVPEHASHRSCRDARQQAKEQNNVALLG
jgi:hypothetical protein